MGGTCETQCCGDEQNLEVDKNDYFEVITDHKHRSKHTRLVSEKRMVPQSSYKNLLTTQATEANEKVPRNDRNQSSIHLTEEFESFENTDSHYGDTGLD